METDWERHLRQKSERQVVINKTCKIMTLFILIGILSWLVIDMIPEKEPHHFNSDGNVYWDKEEKALKYYSRNDWHRFDLECDASSDIEFEFEISADAATNLIWIE